MSSLDKYSKNKPKTKTGETGKSIPHQISPKHKVTVDGVVLGKLKDMKNSDEKVHVDCPSCVDHVASDRYAWLVELPGGDMGIQCSGNRCREGGDEHGKMACYIPKVKREDASKAFGKEKPSGKKKKKKVKNIGKAVHKLFDTGFEPSELIPTTFDCASQAVIYKYGIHLFYGLSGTFKSFTTIRLLGETDFKYKYYLDGEGNSKLLSNYCTEYEVTYIAADVAQDKFEEMLKWNVDMSDYCFIIDSFAKTFPSNMSNNQAQDTNILFANIREIAQKSKATFIVIDHATASKERRADGTPDPETAKLAGNEEGKIKDLDLLYRVSPIEEGAWESGVRLECHKTRVGEFMTLGTKVLVKYQPSSEFSKEDQKDVEREDITYMLKHYDDIEYIKENISLESMDYLDLMKKMKWTTPTKMELLSKLVRLGEDEHWKTEYVMKQTVAVKKTKRIKLAKWSIHQPPLLAQQWRISTYVKSTKTVWMHAEQMIRKREKVRMIKRSPEPEEVEVTDEEA